MRSRLSHECLRPTSCILHTLTPLLLSQSGIRKNRQILLEFLLQRFRKAPRRRRHQAAQREEKGNDSSRNQYILPTDRNNKAAFSSRRDFFPERGRRFAPRRITLLSEFLDCVPKRSLLGCIKLDASFGGVTREPPSKALGLSCFRRNSFIRVIYVASIRISFKTAHNNFVGLVQHRAQKALR